MNDLEDKWLAYDTEGIIRNLIFNTKEALIQYLRKDDLQEEMNLHNVEKYIIHGKNLRNGEELIVMNAIGECKYYLHQVGSFSKNNILHCLQKQYSIEKLLDEELMNIPISEFKEDPLYLRIYNKLVHLEIKTLQEIIDCETRGILYLALGRKDYKYLIDFLEGLDL